MRTKFHYMLALAMLVTGSLNTLSTKAADQQSADGTDEYDNPHAFAHPLVQAQGMFIGEFLCLLAFFVFRWWATKRGRRDQVDTADPNFNPLMLAIPAACDMTATSTMYVGLTLTYSSNFQMLRSSVVVFVAVLSRIVFKRDIKLYRWIGVALVAVGTAVVGTAGLACPDNGKATAAPNPALGNMLIIAAQMIVAAQMVIEEALIGKRNLNALQVVGWEGTWGFLMLTCVVTGLYFVKLPAALNLQDSTQAGPHFADPIDALTQLANNKWIVLFVLGNMLSIAFYNFSGITVTKVLDASTRMILDSLRTVVIWATSLGLGWQAFCYVQAIGFVILLAGTLVYNAIVRLPGMDYSDMDASSAGKTAELSKQPLLSGEGSVNDDLEHGLAAPSPLLPRQDQLMTPSLGRATAIKQR